MDKYIFLLVLNFLCICSYGQSELSTHEKIKDFKYLYKTLNENYPYFEAEKRMNDFDWLEHKNEFIDRIRKTSNDSLYFIELISIIDEMHSGHTGFKPTSYRDYYLDIFKDMNTPYVRPWIDVLEQADDSPDYWCHFLKGQKGKSYKVQPLDGPNYSDTIISDNIGVMTINTFGYKRIQEDSLLIDSFLKKLVSRGINNLIIDIQRNHGGAVKYWTDNVVKRLIKDSITFTSYPTIKKGSVNKRFYPDYFENGDIISQDYNNEFVNLPSEILQNKYYIKTVIQTLTPSAPIPYHGKIYLLVSRNVFSSSEAFAQFCKTTRWATIVGETTGGDGIGSNPVIIMLPKSKLLLRYPPIGGLNHDGSFNYEKKTEPDIVIDSDTYDERLKKLVELINSKAE